MLLGKVVLLLGAVALFIWSLTLLPRDENMLAILGLIAGLLLVLKAVCGVLSKSRESSHLTPLWDQGAALFGLFGVALGIPVLLYAVNVPAGGVVDHIFGLLGLGK